ncbi:MAG TPA: hypothetical protein ENJ82_14160, partial [Bacteroidetes bacterium]|nr:hypothetical protein [Bacteroidota bacterium]
MLPQMLLGQPARDLALTHARLHARTLAAPKMLGRGYQQKGHLMAATYIAEQFKLLGLAPVKWDNPSQNEYFQDFRLSLNLVNGKPNLVLGEQVMEIGEDYIVKANSGRGEILDAKVCDLGYGLPENFNKSFKGKIVLFRAGLPERITK